MHFSLSTMLDDVGQQALHKVQYLTYCVEEWKVSVRKSAVESMSRNRKTVDRGRSKKNTLW